MQHKEALRRIAASAFIFAIAVPEGKIGGR